MDTGEQPKFYRPLPNLYPRLSRAWTAASYRGLDQEEAMSRKHAFVISIALGLAAIAGATAALRTAQLGTPAAVTKPAATSLSARAKALDRQEAALRLALARRPPRLPAVPSVPASPAQPAPAPTAVRVVQAASFGNDSGHGDDDGSDDHGAHGGGGDDD